MNRLFFAVTILLLLCSACGNRRIGSRLKQAEELIAADRLDSALSIIESIDSTAIPDDEDRAHYYMLNTRLLYCLYKPVTDTAQIRWAANYYSTHDKDKIRLANTYYYLGMLELEKNNTVEAARHLKKAEEAALLTKDLNLKHKIYDALSTLNFRTDNFSLALRYANMTLDCARKTGNNLWLAYSYNHLACIHEQIGNTDSAWSYIQKCVPFTHALNDKERSMIYNMLGDFYLRRGDYDMAINHIGQAYEITPHAQTCNLLAGIYSSRGDRQKARELWKQALDSASREVRSQILDTIATHYYAHGKSDSAYIVVRKLMALRDSLSKERETVAINEIQLKYEHQADKRHYDKLLIRALYILIGLILIIAIGAYVIILLKVPAPATK